jgi:hypothetical protein
MKKPRHVATVKHVSLIERIPASVSELLQNVMKPIQAVVRIAAVVYGVIEVIWTGWQVMIFIGAQNISIIQAPTLMRPR